MINSWFVIVNPTSGNGDAKKKWPRIYNQLKIQDFKFEHHFTTFNKHSVQLVKMGIEKGFTNFICVGGDGTLHNIVNGILNEQPITISKIKIGIIPIGTGNDWVKTYSISKNINKAILTIKANKTIEQDLGKLYIENTTKNIYFNNLAGVGFDGYVVNKVHKFKHLGFLAYLTGALVSLAGYKKSKLQISFNNTFITTKTIMLLIGLCKFSGGGMQLTKNPNPTDGLFDISLVEKLNLLTILKNLVHLFNGKITNQKFVKTYKTSQLRIKNLDNNTTYIQADGEIVGTGNFYVQLIPKALRFIVN